MSTEDPQPETEETSNEDPRPDALRPQEIPTATLTSLPPRAREQALPEKDDDRFFDRWVVDKARDLGSRAVKGSVVDRLKEATQSFAEWRSLRHKPAAERASMDDRALVASTQETIDRANAEAKRLGHEAELAERTAELGDAEATAAEKRRLGLRPALRGGSFDTALVVAANLVLLAVDFFIIRLALERLPVGDPRDYIGTAATMGAGAVVIGDALGWIGATATVNKDGGFKRPAPPAIAAMAALLILATWFFFELGSFRDEALALLGKGKSHPIEPTFFTAAQILFLAGAAVSSFGFTARRNGRELQDLQKAASERGETSRKQGQALRGRAEEAWETAAKAPALRKQAQERIKAREKIANGDAARDRKQGEYLKRLIDPEYARERADVESGVRIWQTKPQPRSQMPPLLLWVLPILGGLLGGGIAYLGLDHQLFPTVTIGVIVAFSVLGAVAYYRSIEADGSDETRSRPYIAKLMATVRFSDERASDIERLVPFPPPEPERGRNGVESNGGEQAKIDELKKRIAAERGLLGDNGGDV